MNKPKKRNGRKLVYVATGLYFRVINLVEDARIRYTGLSVAREIN